MGKELEADKRFAQMMKDRDIREEMDRLATPNQWKADKEFTDIPDDKFPGKERIKQVLAHAENDRNSTKTQIPEPVGKWLESRGIDVDTLLRLEPLLRKYDSLTDEQKMRFEELKDFEPNPGKATLNRIGETKYVAGDHGLPIYQEDVDMIKKAQPLAKKLVELQKKNQEQEPVEEKQLSEMTAQEKIDYWCAKEEEEEKKQTLSKLKDIIDEVRNVKPEELNVGPDTTENIHEISEEEETPDVMWHFDPESQRFKPVPESIDEEDPGKIHPIGIIRNWTPEEKTKRLVKEFEEYYKEPAATECNKNVSDPGDYYRYGNILKRMDETHTRKNNDYGDAAYQGYKKYGPAYFLVQLHNKLSRLESLTINSKTQMVKDESIDDTLLDMANYAVMYLESRHRDD